MKTEAERVLASVQAHPYGEATSEQRTPAGLMPSGREMALLQQLLDEVDDCPGLTMGPDKWLSDKIREGFAAYFAILAATPADQKVKAPVRELTDEQIEDFAMDTLFAEKDEIGVSEFVAAKKFARAIIAATKERHEGDEE